jgi:flagellum-specific peptidoglycan hydrolase FlgJ
LESRWGQSSLAKYYNFGGIKDFRQDSDVYFADTKEFENGRMKVKKQPFRKFKNLDEYVNYKINLFGNENYDVYSYAPEMMYRRLTSAQKKYATDPDYERKLNNVYYTL